MQTFKTTAKTVKLLRTDKNQTPFIRIHSHYVDALGHENEETTKIYQKFHSNSTGGEKSPNNFKDMLPPSSPKRIPSSSSPSLSAKSSPCFLAWAPINKSGKDTKRHNTIHKITTIKAEMAILKPVTSVRRHCISSHTFKSCVMLLTL